MKQSDVGSLPMQPAPRPASGPAGGKASPGQPVAGAALLSAEAVVAAAARKKAMARNDTSLVTDEAPRAVSDGDDLPFDADAEKAGPPRDPTVHGRAAPEGQHSTNTARRRGGSGPARSLSGVAQGDSDETGQQAACNMRGAIVLDAGSEEEQGARESTLPGMDGRPDERVQAPAPAPRIPGIGDRAHHLAMVAAPGTPTLRPPKSGRQSTIQALRPTSRAECERRCGSDGFCDPSSELGCGGMHCGRKYDGV